MSKSMIGPITLEAKVHFATSEGQIGAVTVGLPPGATVSHQRLLCAIGQALAVMPPDYRLLDGSEFLNHVLVREKTGRSGDFACPRDMEFDVQALVASARRAAEEAAHE